MAKGICLFLFNNPLTTLYIVQEDVLFFSSKRKFHITNHFLAKWAKDPLYEETSSLCKFAEVLVIEIKLKGNSNIE